MKYNIIDLFCGIGGFSHGFEMTNRFNTVLGVDFWDVALKTYTINHPLTKTECGDITKLDNDFFKSYHNEVDVIIAGPPCQGFSMAGKRNVFDVRNSLFKEVMRIVNVVRPKIVVIENVVGLLSMQTPEGQDVKEEIIKHFTDMGYKANYQVLTAADYGVPQNRKRAIFIASRIGEVKFPHPQYGTTERPYNTTGIALSNIPENGGEYLEPENDYQRLMAGRTKEIANHNPIKHSDIVVKRMHSVPQGGNWQDIPPEIGATKGKYSDSYRRLNWNDLSVTMTNIAKPLVTHPLYDRVLTIREVCRIQSFDDDFIITGSRCDQYQELGNAVPPLLGKAIGETVAELLDTYKENQIES